MTNMICCVCRNCTMSAPPSACSNLSGLARSASQSEYWHLTKCISRTDLHFLTLSRRKKTPGGFSSNASTNTATGQCSLPVPDISQSTLETEKCSQDEPASLLCVGEGGGAGCGGIKKIPPKVAPKPRQSLIIQLVAENKR